MEFSEFRDWKTVGKLNDDITLFGKVFRNDDIFCIRRAASADGRWRLALLFFDGMVDNDLVDRHLLHPILRFSPRDAAPDLAFLAEQLVTTDTAEVTPDFPAAVDRLLHGDTLILLDGDARILCASTKGYARRGIEEPDGERLVRGPKEGFTESLVTNTALLRRKLLSPDLKLVTMQPSARSRQRLCVAYLDTLVNRAALQKLMNRLKDVRFDLLLDTHYIEETISDYRWTPFKTIGSTEKPDIAAAKLMEGKILLLLDGTPVVSVLPFLFIEYFQSGDDYYTGFYFGSIGRLLRIAGFLLTVTLPAAYQAMITYHQEIIPTKFLISIASARTGVPFPTFLELLLMLFAFEILREAGSMMPGSVGQALSTVGAVVIGQAAVDARIVSAPLVIVVAMTGLCGMMTPKLKSAVIVLRLFLLAFSGVLGLFGTIFGATLVAALLFSMNSFGIPYMSYVGTMKLSDLRDTAIRAPIWKLRYRPKKGMTEDYIRE